MLCLQRYLNKLVTLEITGSGIYIKITLPLNVVGLTMPIEKLDVILLKSYGNL